MARILLENVTKRFGDVVAVNDFSLEIQDQEFLVLVGPSGCGKSTTLRMIAGLEEMTTGNIWIGDRLVNDVQPKDRNIAMVFQNYALYPHMRVYDNLAFALRLRKFSKPEIDARVKEAASILGITDLLRRMPNELSGGQKQRVALGRAIVREPAAFLMDEPLSNLDAKLRNQMRTEISRLHARLQTTTVYVTHDQTEAMTMGDRIVVMKDGVMQQVDSPKNLYDKPANLFVAGFIGSPAMNFLSGRVEDDSVVMGPFTVKLPGEALEKARQWNGKAVVLGIRPENLEIGDELREAHPEWTIDATVDLVEPLGAEAHVHFSAGEYILIARVEGTNPERQNTQVRLTLDLRYAHLFDAATGVSLQLRE